MRRPFFALVIVTFVAVASVACAGHASIPAEAGLLAEQRSAPLVQAHWSKVSIGKFADPYGVAVDSAGNVFVADPGSKTVVKITPGGAREIIGDFSVAIGSKFDPQGVSVGAPGSLVYVADKGTRAVWSVKADNTVAPLFATLPSSVHYPRSVAYGPGAANGVYVGIVTSLPASSRGVVRCVLLACPVFGAREFSNPYGVAVDHRGNVYVADAGSKTLYRIDGAGQTPIGTFSDPYGVAVTTDGAEVFVADAGAKKVYQGKPDGTSWTEIGTFGDPYGVAVAANGDVYVADAGSKDVWRLTP